MLAGKAWDMQRVFASDFDGTLHFWDSDELVGRQDLAAIEAFRSEGGLFGVCTGRPLFGLTKQTGDAIAFDFYITMSGATVFDRDLTPLWRRSIPRDVVRALYDEFAGAAAAGEVALLCAADDYWCLTERDTWEPLVRAGSFDEIPDPFCGFAMGTDTDEEAAQIAAEIDARFGDVAKAFQNLNSIDVVPAGCSKGEGLRIVAEYFGADLTAGMGDSFNDLPMLEAADVAYTFPASDQRVRAGADVLATSVAEALADFSARI